MSTEREPIGVIGTGYVGLVTAAGFAELGNEVWCVDIDAEKIARLQRGEVPIYEPGLEELLARNRGVCTSRPTWPRRWRARDCCSSRSARRRPIPATPTSRRCTRWSARCPASDHHALVMKSTVPCGTGASIQRVFGEQGKGGLRYVSCPEFLKEGSAVKDFLNPDRVVVGDDGDWAGDAVVELYAPLEAPLVRTDIASAEMVKLASNAFLATKISFINEIANVCEETGADVVEVARGMGLDERIGSKFLQAGIGYGGSCFPKDVSALKQLAGNSGYHFQLLTAVIEVNELQKRRVIAQAREAPRGAWSASASRCSGWRSSRTPTTCAEHPRWCWPPGCRPTAPIVTAYRPDRRRGGAQADAGSEPAPVRRSMPCTAPTRSCWSPSGRSSSSSTGRPSPRRCAARW